MFSAVLHPHGCRMILGAVHFNRPEASCVLDGRLCMSSQGLWSISCQEIWKETALSDVDLGKSALSMHRYLRMPTLHLFYADFVGKRNRF